MRVHEGESERSEVLAPPRVEGPPASATALRALQGRVGNRAVGRLLRSHPELVGLRRSRLLRAVIELENLTQVAATPGRGMSPKTIEGSKIPHIEHRYRMPTAAGGALEELAYSTESWVNGPVQRPGADVPAAEDLRPGITALVRWPLISAGIQHWSCNDSIFKGLVQQFVLGRQEPSKWYAPSAQAGERVTLDVPDTALSTPANRRLTMHLLTLRASAHWRANTMKQLNRGEFEIKRTVAKQPQASITVTPKWDDVLKTIRRMIQGLLVEAINDPNAEAAVPPPADQRSRLDIALVRALNEDEQIGQLTARHLVQIQQDGTWKLFESRTNGSEVSTIDKAARDGLGQALRHLRFLAYIEWRATYELLANASPQ